MNVFIHYHQVLFMKFSFPKQLGKFVGTFAIICAGSSIANASGLPVKQSHPRILLDSTWKARLIAKKNANDPTWTAFNNRANALLNFPIYPYTYSDRNAWFNNKLHYGFQGIQWYEDALTLALAYQVTGNTAYSNKAIALANEMIRAENDPSSQPVSNEWGVSYRNPFGVNLSYASRYVGPAMALIYDWCYDVVPDSMKTKMVNQMNAYFLHLRTSGGYTTYERTGPATGNFFGGHLFCAAYMGYATAHENPQAQRMIDWARIRFDGTSSGLLSGQDIPESNRMQAFEGPFPSRFERITNVPVNKIKGKPFNGGFNTQGWAYGTNEFNRTIEYMLTVKSSTNENVTTTYQHWFADMFKSIKHAHLPNKLAVDNVGDWGGNQGAIIDRRMPLRLAFVLEGTNYENDAYYFAHTEIPQGTSYGQYYKDVTIYAASAWENFLYKMPKTVNSTSTYPLFYAPFGTGYPQGGTTNGAVARFISRSSWDTTATWMSAEMGAAFYGDHHQYQAGHITMTKGKYPLLISPANYRGAAGMGVIGSHVDYIVHSSVKNTLFFDDWGVYNRAQSVDQVGGQGRFGTDRIVASDANNSYTYVRSDLSTAYNNDQWPREVRDTVNRTLEKFYRTIAYHNSGDFMVVFDQLKAKNSTHVRGQYEKHLRWHFPTQPSINGNTAFAQNGNSKVYVTTLLPQQPTISSAYLNPNSDNRFGSIQNAAFNCPNWRIEVRVPNNPLECEYLTVLMPGNVSMAQPFTQNISSADNSMKGAMIIKGEKTYIVMFNSGVGQTPTPIETVQYYAGEGASSHVLGGMIPNAYYNVYQSNGNVLVMLADNGTYRASAGGVLEFSLDASSLKISSENSSSSSENISTTLDATIAPLPASDFVRLHVANTSVNTPLTISIGSLAGITQAILFDGVSNSTQRTIESDVSHLPSGTYYLTVKNGTVTKTLPLTIVR